MFLYTYIYVYISFFELYLLQANFYTIQDFTQNSALSFLKKYIYNYNLFLINN